MPLPSLRGPQQLANAAGVLMALELLQERLPVSETAIRNGLRDVVLPGRCQFVPGAVEMILDVSHNPHGAARLAEVLGLSPCSGRTHLVLGMLDDKDVGGFVTALSSAVDLWYPASLDNPRGLSAEELDQRMRGLLPVNTGTSLRGCSRGLSRGRRERLGRRQNRRMRFLFYRSSRDGR